MPTAIIRIPAAEALAHQRLLDMGPHLALRGQPGILATYSVRFSADLHAEIVLAAQDPPHIEGTLFERAHPVSHLPPTDGLLGEHSFSHHGGTYRVRVEVVPPPAASALPATADEMTPLILAQFPGRAATDPTVRRTVEAGMALLAEIAALPAGAIDTVWEGLVDLVDDCMGHDAAAVANGLPDGEDGELEIDACFAQGASINNGGVAGQIALILSYHGLEDGVGLVRALTGPKPPTGAALPRYQRPQKA